MLTTLARKLTAVLLVLFCAVAGFFTFAMMITTRLHNQEANQRFHSSLAAHIARDEGIVAAGGVDKDKAKELFHMLMVVNPHIEHSARFKVRHRCDRFDSVLLILSR